MKYPIETPDIIEGSINFPSIPNFTESPIALNSPIVSHSPVDNDPEQYLYSIAPKNKKELCAVQPAPPHQQNLNIPYEERCLQDNENQQYDPLTRRQNADFIRGNFFSDRYKSKYDEYTVEMPKVSLPTNTIVSDSYFYPYSDFFYRYNDQYKTYPRDDRFYQTQPEYTYPNLITNYPFLLNKTKTMDNVMIMEGFENVRESVKDWWKEMMIYQKIIMIIVIFVIFYFIIHSKKKK
jgi:hypothetical protein